VVVTATTAVVMVVRAGSVVVVAGEMEPAVPAPPAQPTAAATMSAGSVARGRFMPRRHTTVNRRPIAAILAGRRPAGGIRETWDRTVRPLPALENPDELRAAFAWIAAGGCCRARHKPWVLDKPTRIID